MRGLSQRELGFAMGLGKATGGVRINRYEKQSSTPSIIVAGEIADALGIPVACLFADTKEISMQILDQSMAARLRLEGNEGATCKVK